MIRGRVKQLVVAAGASALVAIATLAVVPSVASAQVGTQPTTTTVTAKPSSTLTGRQVLLTAKVAPVSGDVGVPTGTVAFSITGSDASNVTCHKSNTVMISHRGKAECHVLPGQLLAAASPYTVNASYSGDINFADSSGGTSVTVGKVKTATTLKVAPAPHKGTANAVTATVTTAHGGSFLTGNVLFSVSTSPSTTNLKRTCTNGGDSQPLAVSGNVGIATCDLRAGWFTVPKKNKANPNPQGSWDVTASYSGDGSFKPSVGTESGTAKS